MTGADTLLAAAQVHTLGPAGGMQITVMDQGATWLACRVPLADGSTREVLLGHATPGDWATQPGYLGAVVGRYANRIAQARFTIDGREHRLLPNEGPHQLHGGPEGFSRRRWRLQEHGPLHLRLALHSPAGDQGYPGALDAAVEYRLHPEALAVTVTFEAEVSEACPVNLTSHAYFNLDAEPGPVLGHRLRVAAAHLLPVRTDLIPTGEPAPVAGTPFDLRVSRRIGEVLGQGEQQRLAGGYDHCYVLDADASRAEVPAVLLESADGKLAMQLYTTYPGLQVYSGNQLEQAAGRDGRRFVRHAGIALEPQFFPDAPNHPLWREMGCVLQPGERLRRWMRLCFNPR